VYGVKDNEYKILVWKPGGETHLFKHGGRLERIIKMDLQEIGWDHALDCCESG